MHTQGMTVDEATKLFETQAHQPRSVAVQEAKRGTSDALYGYYTSGQADDSEAARGLQGEDWARSIPCSGSTTRSSSSVRCLCR